MDKSLQSSSERIIPPTVPEGLESDSVRRDAQTKDVLKKILAEQRLSPEKVREIEARIANIGQPETPVIAPGLGSKSEIAKQQAKSDTVVGPEQADELMLNQHILEDVPLMSGDMVLTDQAADNLEKFLGKLGG